jgi:GNAT superfamily N-acetyltransferase
VRVKAQLFALPLAPWERGGLTAALLRTGLPTDDVDAPDVLFWRFERNDMPVGFGGLEVHDDQALLRSLVTLPPVRHRGIGTAMVEVLETEAVARNIRAALPVDDRLRWFFRPARLCAIRSRRSPRRDPRYRAIRRALSPDRDRNDQAAVAPANACPARLERLPGS